MNNKGNSISKNIKNLNFEVNKMNSSGKLKKKKEKSLPWWVELLFVQIGLPDSILINVLKVKKRTKELVKNEKRSFLIIFFWATSLAYFYPVVKHAKNKLNCEKIAKNYILQNKNITQINNKELKMLSTNFCYGGEEIYEINN